MGALILFHKSIFSVSVFYNTLNMAVSHMLIIYDQNDSVLPHIKINTLIFVMF